MERTTGTIYDRKEYDAVLPPRAEFLGKENHPKLGEACCKFRAVSASENMGAGETFHMTSDNASVHYPSRSTFQRRGTLNV